MSTEKNKALIRRAFEDFNQGHVGEADEYFTPNFVYHDVTNPQVSSREEYLQLLRGLRAAIPGQFTIEDLIAEGDRVVVRYTFQGTHQGPWRNVPPTGKPIKITGTNIYRFENGKIAEIWHNADTLGLLQQLGLVPTMA